MREERGSNVGKRHKKPGIAGFRAAGGVFLGSFLFDRGHYSLGDAAGTGRVIGHKFQFVRAGTQTERRLHGGSIARSDLLYPVSPKFKAVDAATDFGRRLNGS